MSIGPVKQFFERKIVIIFLYISLNMFFGCSKKPLIKMVLLSTHNICFGCQNFFFSNALLSGSLDINSWNAQKTINLTLLVLI